MRGNLLEICRDSGKLWGGGKVKGFPDKALPSYNSSRLCIDARDHMFHVQTSGLEELLSA